LATEKNSIKLNGTSIEITNFTITDSTVVSVFKNEEDNGTNLSTYLENVISIGTKTLGLASAGAGVERLKDSITAAQDAIAGNVKKMDAGFAESTKKVQVEFEKIITELTGDESPLATQVNELLETFTKDIEDMTASEASPIRAGIKAQIDAMASKLIDDVMRQNKAQKSELAKLMDPTDPTSPLRGLFDQVKGITNALEDVRQELKTEVAVAEVVEVTTLGGGKYEEVSVAAVQRIASYAGDDCVPTGDVTGRVPRSKKGDGVVDLKVGASVHARIVLEAKNSPLSKKQWEAEMAGSKENRAASGFIGLCKNLVDMPNASRLMILDSQSIVIAYDPAIDDPQLLALVYQLVKINSLANSGNLEDLDVAEVNRNIEEAVMMLGQFDALQKTAASIENAGKKLKDDLKEIRTYVLERLANVKSAISESLEPEALEFGYNLELEAPEED
jgi:hypothetical protein